MSLGVKDEDEVRCASFTQGIDNLGDGLNVVLGLISPLMRGNPQRYIVSFLGIVL